MGSKEENLIFDLRARLGIVKDLLTKIGNFDPVNKPTCQIPVKAGLSAEDVKWLLRIIYKKKDIEFMACSDGCDDVCPTGGGRIFLYRECPDCGKELIVYKDSTNSFPTSGIIYTCPTYPLTKYQFEYGELKKIL